MERRLGANVEERIGGGWDQGGGLRDQGERDLVYTTWCTNEGARGTVPEMIMCQPYTWCTSRDSNPGLYNGNINNVNSNVNCSSNARNNDIINVSSNINSNGTSISVEIALAKEIATSPARALAKVAAMVVSTTVATALATSITTALVRGHDFLY